MLKPTCLAVVDQDGVDFAQRGLPRVEVAPLQREKDRAPQFRVHDRLPETDAVLSGKKKEKKKKIKSKLKKKKKRKRRR